MIPRRRWRTGSVRKNKATGLWQFRLPLGGGRRQESKYEFATDAAAVTAMDALRDELRRRRPVDALTLGEFMQADFLPAARRRWRGLATERAFLGKWKHVQKSGLDTKPLRSVTRADVRRMYRGIDGIRVDLIHQALHAVLQQAVDDELLDANPAARMKLDMKPRDPDARRADPEDLAKLITCPAVWLPDRLLMRFACATGLRPGEWRNLELADLHMDSEPPYALVRYGGDGHAPTKSGKDRKVLLLGDALAALLEWLPQLTTWHKVNPFGLVFPNRRNGRRIREWPFGWSRKEKCDRLTAYCRAAGTVKRIIPHMFRHAFATGALTGKVSAELDAAWKVQVMLGHAKLATTQRYLHHGESELFDAVRERGRNRVQEQKNAMGPSGIARSTVCPLPSFSAPEGAAGGPHAGSGSAAPDSTLFAELRELTLAIADGSAPAPVQLCALAQRVEALRLAQLGNGDPVLSAVRRVLAADAQQIAAMLELVRLVVPAVPQSKEEAS
jgi:integrase